jgi:hypothetical protein
MKTIVSKSITIFGTLPIKLVFRLEVRKYIWRFTYSVQQIEKSGLFQLIAHIVINKYLLFRYIPHIYFGPYRPY